MALHVFGAGGRSEEVHQTGRNGNTTIWDLCAGIISLSRWVGKGKGLTINMESKEGAWVALSNCCPTHVILGAAMSQNRSYFT